MVCWGANDADQSRVLVPGDFAAVSAGAEHACGIYTDNTLYCWGSRELTSHPRGSYKAVSAGTNHTCALRTDNTITCWGANNAGQTDPPDMRD